MAKPQKHVFVCAQTRPPGHPRGSCANNGSQQLLQSFWQELQQRNLFDIISITYSGCIGPCDNGPNVVVYPEGVLYCGVTKEDVPVIFDEHLIGGTPVARLLPPAGVWD
jgi:(2Fe-2S) ferredoxin